MNLKFPRSRILGPLLLVSATLLSGVGSAILGTCGPFTDVVADSFCPFVLEIFYLGITTGTTPTTYDPAGNVTRLQMAAFLSRSVDGVLKRGSRRAALNRFWTSGNELSLGLTTVGFGPVQDASDGTDIWVANGSSATVSRVRSGDAKLVETWTGAQSAIGVLTAAGRVFITGGTSPGSLYRIDPALPAGAVTTVASNLGNTPLGIAFDGTRIWTANLTSVSIVTLAAALPYPVTTVSPGFTSLRGALFDGTDVWVSDFGAGSILRLSAAGAILQTVTVGTNPDLPLFDGTNIWVPNFGSASVSIVRRSTGAILATLTGNGLNGPAAAAFDGERILVTNFSPGADSVSLWKAADFSPLGAFPTGAASNPIGVCSDGIHFWITLQGTGRLARF